MTRKMRLAIAAGLLMICFSQASGARSAKVKSLSPRPSAWNDLSTQAQAVAKQLDMVEIDWMAQDGRRPLAPGRETFLAARARRRLERLGAIPSFVFLKNTEFGNAPRLDMSMSDGLYNGKPFKAGASIMRFTPTQDGKGRTETLLHDPQGMMRDLDVSYDGKRILFSWKKNQTQDDFHIYEMTVATCQIRQVTWEPGVADIQARYLPDGRILYHSTRCVNTVDCNEKINVVNLYTCDLSGGGIVRLTFDQVSTQFPAVLADGRIVYTRWDYNDRGQIYPQGLFTMNPDGTHQMALYGNNSWFPTSLIQARSIPESADLLAIAAGHHTPPCGSLALVETARGREEGRGIRLLAPEREVQYERKDKALQDGVIFQYPYPLTRDEFLTGCSLFGNKKSTHFGIYWMNRQGQRELLVWDKDASLRHPVPLVPRSRPAHRRATMTTTEPNGLFYVDDIYVGEGLQGIPRGTIKRLRVIGLEFRAAAVGISYNRGEAGNARVCTPVSISGAWDIKTVLGDAKVYADGSTFFKTPARMPVYFQALDANGYAIQSMRSWSTLQPGESFSCVGCHGHKNAAPVISDRLSAAQKAGPQDLDAFYGPARGFSFIKEIQPILDRQCIACHQGKQWTPEYASPDDETSFSLLRRPVNEAISGRNWTESYLALLQAGIDKKRKTYFAFSNEWINWISPQSGPEVLAPYSFGATQSPLLDMLKNGHHDVTLTEEELAKLACWIDLAVPFCGDYTEANSWSNEEQRWYAGQVKKQQRLADLERKE